MNYGIKLNKSMEGHKLYAVGRNNARDRGKTIETLHSIEVVSVARVNAKVKFLSTDQIKTLTVDGRGAHNFDYSFYRSEEDFKADHYLWKIMDTLRYQSVEIPPAVIIKIGELLGVDMTTSHNVVGEPGVGLEE
ncbi:hypothetical protein [Aeromonas veronii]|uniref:hypothetical protein n=1 Tax=Aeromonas veronii TaxID=654 RepID=UPI000E08E71E|nr:hypothetical protein [Aeromonas veronii]RDE60944.1 hypothetical protein DV708_16720 [Aeromonas veronii]